MYISKHTTPEIFVVDLTGEEREVAITYLVRNWTESHPFGSTYAAEHLTEIDDRSYRYEVDGVEMSEKAFERQFGEPVRKIIDEMLFADESEHRMVEEEY